MSESNYKFTFDDLANLKKAIAKGVLRVRMGENETQYRTVEELQKAIEMVELELKLRSRGPFLFQVTTNKL